MQKHKFGTILNRKCCLVITISILVVALLTGCRNTTSEQLFLSSIETVTETAENAQERTEESVTEATAEITLSTDVPDDFIGTNYTADTKEIDKSRWMIRLLRDMGD